jgi:hypothetical protein
MRDAETTLLIIEDRGKMPRRNPCRATDTETDGDRQIGPLESRVLGKRAPRNAVLNP